MVKAGLTPMEALQTATISPPRFVQREKDFGTVAIGKVADLILLDANPLDYVSNTTKINSVIYGGKIVLRSRLDRMLDVVEGLAAHAGL